MSQNKKNRSLDSRISASVLVTLCRLLTGITSRWKSPPPEDVVRIYYANHSSHLDGLVIWSSMPRALRDSVHPVAGSDYWLSSGLKRYIAQRIFQAVLIDRTGGEDPIAERQRIQATLEEALDSGKSLILFPEGTRGSGESISEFKAGLYHLAKARPDVELVPVYLENLNRVMPKGSALVVPVMCNATFGDPIPRVADGESKDDFLTRSKTALEALQP